MNEIDTMFLVSSGRALVLVASNEGGISPEDMALVLEAFARDLRDATSQLGAKYREGALEARR